MLVRLHRRGNGKSGQAGQRLEGRQHERVREVRIYQLQSTSPSFFLVSQAFLVALIADRIGDAKKGPLLALSAGSTHKDLNTRRFALGALLGRRPAHIVFAHVGTTLVLVSLAARPCRFRRANVAVPQRISSRASLGVSLLELQTRILKRKSDR
ncbi:unnamed protein product [Chondrus crispus]|uniref:Uncharacterized protein n=1 Tax=Chondrus crispus TaxID=2769 RepID=R7QNR6_CHOCR|nr:unnamed protein product [Chondrus crispus]CDF39121.1 unnamed protein product [Chondrus crispus]|eukprot:XP_005719032.1 unnamed protein product [Chondrus crispus]